jgi:hypothetical protein
MHSVCIGMGVGVLCVGGGGGEGSCVCVCDPEKEEAAEAVVVELEPAPGIKSSKVYKKAAMLHAPITFLFSHTHTNTHTYTHTHTHTHTCTHTHTHTCTHYPFLITRYPDHPCYPCSCSISPFVRIFLPHCRKKGGGRGDQEILLPVLCCYVV